MENNTLDLMTALDKDDSRVQKIKGAQLEVKECGEMWIIISFIDGVPEEEQCEIIGMIARIIEKSFNKVFGRKQGEGKLKIYSKVI